MRHIWQAYCHCHGHSCKCFECKSSAQSSARGAKEQDCRCSCLSKMTSVPISTHPRLSQHVKVCLTCDFDSRRLHLTSCKAGTACPLLLTQPHAMNAIAVHISAQWSGREARYTQRTLIYLWLMSGLTHGGLMMGNWAYRSQKCMRNQQQRVSRTRQWCCRTLTPHSPGLL